MNIDIEQKEGQNGRTSNNERVKRRMKERRKVCTEGGGVDYEREECRERMERQETDWEGRNTDSNIY